MHVLVIDRILHHHYLQDNVEGQLWTASSLPVVIWHYFNCRLMHVLVIDRMLQHHYLQDNVEGQLLDCFFIVGLYFVGSTLLRIQFLFYY